MGGVKVTIELPEELVERAKAQGLTLDSARVAAMIEVELGRIQAARALLDAAQQLKGSLTPDEIEAELAAAKAERIAQKEQRSRRP